MTFNKLNNNQLEIFFNTNDLNEQNMDFNLFVSNPINNHFLTNILERAKQDIGFNKANDKITINSFFTTTGNFIIKVHKKPFVTIPSASGIIKHFFNNNKNFSKESLNESCKQNSCDIYRFNCLADFYSFISEYKNDNSNKISDLNFCLYKYKNNYFFKILSSHNCEKVISLLTEFASPVETSNLFTSKLDEYAQILIWNEVF